jgi:hypothetical protein
MRLTRRSFLGLFAGVVLLPLAQKVRRQSAVVRAATVRAVAQIASPFVGAGSSGSWPSYAEGYA